MSRAPPDIAKLHSLMVFNLGFDVRQEELESAFKKFGEIADVYIPRDHHSGKSRGFAFVRYYDEKDADEALRMDGDDVCGRRVGVQFAKYGRRDGGGGQDRRGRGRDDRGNDRGYDRGNDRGNDRGYSRRQRSYSPARHRSRSRERRRSPPRRRSPSPRDRSRSPRPLSRSRSPRRDSSRRSVSPV
eukprot:280030_1